MQTFETKKNVLTIYIIGSQFKATDFSNKLKFEIKAQIQTLIQSSLQIVYIYIKLC